MKEINPLIITAQEELVAEIIEEAGLLPRPRQPLLADEDKPAPRRRRRRNSNDN